jgi:hypothetical protein
MKFPRLVFISPGKNECQGGTYNAELVANSAEHTAAIKAGFSDSVPEALLACEKAKNKLKVAK